jgi:hypothetical protein
MKAETSIWIWSEIAMAPGYGRKRIAKNKAQSTRIKGR